MRLVELVPHPETLPTVMEVAYSLMTDVGQAPVRLRKEIDGFALNRVQYAIIAESWRLVQVSQVMEQNPTAVTVMVILPKGNEFTSRKICDKSCGVIKKAIFKDFNRIGK